MKDRVTPRQREVLIELCQGKSNKEMAQILYLSPHTITLYMMNLCKKFKANNRTHLALLALFNAIPSPSFIEILVDHSIEGRNHAVS